MRLDHLLSKEEAVGLVIKRKSCSVMKDSGKKLNKIFGADALRGNTRTHPEHDG